MYKLEEIKVIHLEVTQRCQAACSMCDRNKNGGDVNPHIDLSELSLEDCQKIFDKKFISQLKRMYMCGNLGDPIIANDTLEIFRYFRQYSENIELSMNTNAGARDSNWWAELAKIFGKKGHVKFSVDGLRDTNHLYRQNVSWSKVENSMRSFIAAGGTAVWEFIVFDHNQHQVEEARQLSQSMGFSKFTVKKTARFFSSASNKGKESHQSYDRKGNQTIELKKPDVVYQNAALSKEDMLIEKHGSMDLYYDQIPIKCKVKEEKSLFITAEGLALPCCWTAGRMYKWWHKNPKVEPIWDYIDFVGKENLDARNGLLNVFSTGIFENIERGWELDSCEVGKLKVCAQKCGIEFDPFGEQYS
jgi:MoaA/NifB/PqqE/SkfB family radical SAM enzyme